MSNNLFVLDVEGRMQQLTATRFLKEEDLQGLLADHPALLGVGGGDLLLVAREKGVRDGKGQSDRWSLDHLFISREGVPVLVEVKRASDTRARREVVAQMLDYAANGPAYWEVDEIVRAHTETCEKANRDPDETLLKFLDSVGEDNAVIENFWRQVEANMKSGRMRLLFVADKIADELKRIVEFLNEQMRSAEVLAIEVAHYASTDEDGPRTLVPRLIGNTSRAESVKAIERSMSPGSVEECLQGIGEQFGPDAEKGARRMVEWFREENILHGPAGKIGTIAASSFTAEGKPTNIFYLRGGKPNKPEFVIFLDQLGRTSPFSDEETRSRLDSRLQEKVKGLSSNGKPTGGPSVLLASLNDDVVWEPLKEILSDVIDRLKEGQS